ncbi:MAG: class I SAM-dependent methyltransferase [Kiloniellales bacterium]|nr:class I SAM-dependent methyltransferase [Kiloniellales bacterium]
MSSFERYDRAAPHYDRTRVPIGTEIIHDALRTAARPASEMTLLDAGCGTGAYAAALAGVPGRVIGLDRSAEMLKVARAKLEGRPGRIDFLRGDLRDLPLAEASLDAVMFNQVLHHLEDGDGAYAGHAAALAEAARVLRPGGRLLLNACTHEQLLRGFWFYGLIPLALERALARCAPEGRIRGLLAELGFEVLDRAVPASAVLQGEAYFDACGPLRPEWRQGDSIWALAGPEETEVAVEGVKRLQRDGALEGFMRDRDRERPAVGQVSFFIARRI